MAYNSEDNHELRSLQLTELKVIRLISEICEKHGLRYFMVGGTMLGATRHKGFIPWDDDADVAMPRPDYEKFIEVAPKELPAGYEFLTYRKTEGYHRGFNRVVDMNVTVINASNETEQRENAWVDIFPLDGMPSSRIAQRAHFWYTTFWRFLYLASDFTNLVNLNRPGRKRYLQFLIRFLQKTRFGSNLDTLKLMRKIERLLMKYPYDDSDTVVSFFGAYMTKEITPKALFGEGTLYPFEDLMLRGSDHPDEFLTHFFGDWRTPPADSDKDKHDIRGIEYKE